MKLRAISLTNVRRFQGRTARIRDIADGITTIAAPNEAGKSTFFDALHALFFADHKSKTAEIRTLQPYAKGPVDIAVDIETGAGRFRIEKRYLSSPSARVTDLAAERLIAQAGEAEAWISHTLGTDMAGPAGLLWVRQGLSGFGPEGSGAREKSERERLKEARQTLMSTIAGQIDSITGGRRMDAIMQACAADLDTLATRTGTPKAGGEWHKALRLRESLEAEHGRLAAQVAGLSNALAERRTLRVELEALDDSDFREARRRAVRDAEAAVEAARAHACRIEDAERSLRLADLEASSIRDAIETRKARTTRKSRLEEALAAARARRADAEAEDAAARNRLADSTARLETARAAQRAARARLSQAQSARARRTDLKRKDELEWVLSRIDAHERDRQGAQQTAAANSLTADALEEIEEAARRCALARARREASAATLRIAYSGDLRARRDGADLPGDTDLPIIAPIEIELPGLGMLQARPPQAGAEDHDPSDLTADLDALCAQHGVGDLAAARRARAEREAAERTIARARDAVAAIAPEGSDGLRREYADLQAALGDTGAAETAPHAPQEAAPDADSDALHQALEAADEAESAAARAVEEIRAEADVRAAALTEAQTSLRMTEDALAELDAEDPQDDSAQSDEALQAELSEAEAAGAAARRHRDDLAATAPDIEAAEAELERAQSVRDNAESHRDRIAARVHELDGVIGARADDDIETRLSEIAGALEKASAREGRYAAEVAALTELRGALDAARSAARDAYFEPVKREIEPLLAMIHGPASFEMDPDTMLPARLNRDGVIDDITALSGGAAEQVAILTRLAFARLYAKSGRAVPVILDDALVHSDDERIIRMFTALTRIAKDQQILVLTCRSRAFAELGGHHARIETAEAEAPV